jgi:type I restriction enzyme M protein
MAQLLAPRPGESSTTRPAAPAACSFPRWPRSSAAAATYRTLKLYGQERNLITSGIARMNLFLHGVEDFQIIRGDTLADPSTSKATGCASST